MSEARGQTLAMAAAIAVQSFNKAESVIGTLDSITRSDASAKHQLFILQDGWFGGKQTAKYRAACAETTDALESWISANGHRFASVSFDRADRNNGPYQTAERLINWALETSNAVIFCEDDVIFESDAMQWFQSALTHPMFLRQNVWAIAGESRFFDSYRHKPSAADVCRAVEVADSQDLIDRFVYLDFLPSSCFATTRDKWAEFGETRGTVNGDRAVVNRCQAEGKMCFWPVIARCRDTGMHHPLGYSVRWKGLQHTGFKNSYVVSGMLKVASGELSELPREKKDALLSEFTRYWELLDA